MKILHTSSLNLFFILFLYSSLFGQDNKGSMRGFITCNIGGYSGITEGFPVYVTGIDMKRIYAKTNVGRFIYGKGNYFLKDLPKNTELMLICFSPTANFLLGCSDFLIKSSENDKRVDLKIIYSNTNIGNAGNMSNSPADAIVNLIKVITSFVSQRQLNIDNDFNIALAEYLTDLENKQGYNKLESNPNSLKDIDGNVYKTIKIGNQVWMAENLKTTRYLDGTTIPLVTNATAWVNLSTPGYCWYDNDVANKNTYGALYNWYAVNTGKLAPAGWHVPTDAEWTILTTYLGGESIAGDKLKEEGFSHWLSPNSRATNTYGFSALPGGYRSNNGDFFYMGYFGIWRTSSESEDKYAWVRVIYSKTNDASIEAFPKSDGYSVRCIENEKIDSDIWIEKKYAYISTNPDVENSKWLETALGLSESFLQQPIQDLLFSSLGKAANFSIGLFLEFFNQIPLGGGVLVPESNFELISDGKEIEYLSRPLEDGFKAYRLTEGMPITFIGYTKPAGDYSSLPPILSGYPLVIQISKLNSKDPKNGMSLYKQIRVFDDTEVKNQWKPYLSLSKEKIYLPAGYYIINWGNKNKKVVVGEKIELYNDLPGAIRNYILKYEVPCYNLPEDKPNITRIHLNDDNYPEYIVCFWGCPDTHGKGTLFIFDGKNPGTVLGQHSGYEIMGQVEVKIVNTTSYLKYKPVLIGTDDFKIELNYTAKTNRYEPFW